MKLAFITGGSKGLGLALTNLYRIKGWQVISLARTTAGVDDIYVDLSDNITSRQSLTLLLPQLAKQQYSEILFINNAGCLGPIQSISQIDLSELRNNLNINLLSAIELIQLFMQNFRDHEVRKTIVNISSGAALKGYPGWSLYCASKAGIENFVHAVLEEELHQLKPYRLVNIDPGVMDTDMQGLIRAADVEHFPAKQRFIDYKENGDLLAPEEMASRIEQTLLAQTLPARLDLG